jgi:hypothetical protein
MKISLNRKQIKTLIEVYNHFREVDEFRLSLDDGIVYIGMDLVNTRPHKVVRVDKHGKEL